MTLRDRIEILITLGILIREELNAGRTDPVMEKAEIRNPWFSRENQLLAFEGILKFLEKESLQKWVKPYQLEVTPKTVGIVMAGNIPMVGFHDLLSVLISGHRPMMKLSSKDQVLLPYLSSLLHRISPEFAEGIREVDTLREMDAIIATGSDNAARYFRDYFAKYPHIIRKNRVSCAVIDGSEDQKDLEGLADDVFQYFGQGCRNVSKIYVPESYDLSRLEDAFAKYKSLMDHHKYANNYFYNRSIFLVNSESYRENGYLLMKETSELVSPLSVLYFEQYPSVTVLEKKIEVYRDKIQCIVSREGWMAGSIPFGQAQQPEVWDYADGVDTLKFLSEL